MAAVSFKRAGKDKNIVDNLESSADVSLKYTYDLGEIMGFNPEVMSQITKDNVNSIDCDLIVEAANGPIDFEAEEILEQKNIPIIPDILANSGGVLVSYYEWLQNKRDEYWDEKYIRNKFDEKIEDTFKKIWLSIVFKIFFFT